MTVNPTDKFLVNRSGSSYNVEQQNLMAQLQDDDLLLVNRNSKSYKITGAEFKDSLSSPPIIQSVTLVQDESNLPAFAAQISSAAAVTNTMFTDGLTFDGSIEGDNYATNAFDGDPDTQFSVTGAWAQVEKMALINVTQISGKFGGSDSKKQTTTAYNKNGDIVAQLVDHVGGQQTIPITAGVPIVDVDKIRVERESRPGWFTIEINGEALTAADQNTELKFAVGEDISDYSVGDLVKEFGNGDNGKGTIREIDIANRTVELFELDNSWNAGSYMVPASGGGPAQIETDEIVQIISNQISGRQWSDLVTPNTGGFTGSFGGTSYSGVATAIFDGSLTTAYGFQSQAWTIDFGFIITGEKIELAFSRDNSPNPDTQPPVSFVINGINVTDRYFSPNASNHDLNWIDISDVGPFDKIDVGFIPPSNFGRIGGIRVDGVIITNGQPLPQPDTIKFKTSKDLERLQYGDVIVQNDASGNPATPYGVVGTVDLAQSTITLSAENGQFGPANAGKFAIGPTRSNEGRFTNRDFTTTALMLDNGNPASTKSIRSWVEGSLTLTPKSDEIVNITSKDTGIPNASGLNVKDYSPTPSTVVGDAIQFTSQSKWYGSAADCKTGYVTIADVYEVGTGDFSFSCWVNPSSVNSGFSYPALFGGGNEDLSIVIGGTAAGDGVISLNHVNVTQGPGSSANAVPFDTWTFINVVRSGGTISFYVNGSLDSTAASAANYKGVSKSIGAESGNPDVTQFEGKVNDIRFYNSAYVVPFDALQGQSMTAQQIVCTMMLKHQICN